MEKATFETLGSLFLENIERMKLEFSTGIEKYLVVQRPCFLDENFDGLASVLG